MALFKGVFVSTSGVLEVECDSSDIVTCFELHQKQSLAEMFVPPSSCRLRFTTIETTIINFCWRV